MPDSQKTIDYAKTIISFLSVFFATFFDFPAFFFGRSNFS